MITFLKDSFRELQHVVWPTKEETIRYFIMVLTTLTIFTIYLAIANFVFTEGLFALKDILSK